MNSDGESHTGRDTEREIWDCSINQVHSGPALEEELFDCLRHTGINFAKYENISITVEGEDQIEPVSSIQEAGLHPTLVDNVTRVGYTSLTPVQKHSLPIVMVGRDLMAAAQTGSGKTAAFLIPVIHNLLEGFEPRPSEICHKPECVIITTTRQLAIQIYNDARRFSFRSPLKTSITCGGLATGKEMIGEG